jgi:hypothetical protein
MNQTLLMEFHEKLPGVLSKPAALVAFTKVKTRE